jgi:hypothetical protein
MLFFLISTAALWAADSPFTGRWVLNGGQSKFPPDAAPMKSFLTFTPEGKVIVQEVTSDGMEQTWSYQANPGQEAPLEGRSGQSVVEKRVNANTSEFQWKSGGAVLGTSTMTVSPDGKTLTHQLTIQRQNSKPVNIVMVFQKEMPAAPAPEPARGKKKK